MTQDQIPDNPFRARRRPALLDDDRGSMALLLLVILVGVMLGGLLVPMIITQDRSTRFDTTRVQALDAAQAGMDVLLGDIRQVITGDASKLPYPTSTAPIIGNVNGGPARYSVFVNYWTGNPQDSSSKVIPAAGGFPTTMPSFAQLISTGTVPPAVNGSTSGRTLLSTYQFRSTNITGGVIQISPAYAGSTALCMDAGLPPPGGYPASASISVLMQPCSTLTPPVAQQVFAYRNDLTIQLVSSITTGNPNGLCLTQPSGTAISLSPCQAPGTPTPPPFTQQWSYNQYGAYQSVVAKSSIDGSLGTQCINLASQVAGSQLTLATCDYTAANPVQTTPDPVQSWLPASGVGTGAATAPQWTNYSESGRCIYIPPAAAASDHLWSYPCTQDPWALAVPVGQSFTGPLLPATYPVGQITSGVGAAKTCLASPTTTGWVTAKPCSSSTLQTWTVYNGPKAPSLAYSTRYTIKNKSSGLCLGLGTPAYTDTWSAIQAEPCNGAVDQKWNVPPNALSLTLQNAEK